jgi:hypothetical protein
MLVWGIASCPKWVPGRVKTCARGEAAELFSQFSSFDGASESGSYLIQRDRDKRSTRKLDVGVFTQPGSKTEVELANADFWFTPQSRHPPVRPSCRLSTNNGSQGPHSITSSARASKLGESARPRALAVLRLITNSNFVGCSTGISPGLVPFRILSTNSAARRNWSGMFDP